MSFDGTYTGRRPSSEWRFHRDILRQRTDIDVVLHCHSIFATTLACHHKTIPSFHYMTGVAGGTTIRCAKYATFGTQQLSDYALEALEDRLACLLGQHGQISLGKTLESALWLANEVETLSRMYVHALTLGDPPILPDDEMARVIEQMRRMSYGQAPGPRRHQRRGKTPASELTTPRPSYISPPAIRQTISAEQGCRIDAHAPRRSLIRRAATVIRAICSGFRSCWIIAAINVSSRSTCRSYTGFSRWKSANQWSFVVRLVRRPRRQTGDHPAQLMLPLRICSSGLRPVRDLGQDRKDHLVHHVRMGGPQASKRSNRSARSA